MTLRCGITTGTCAAAAAKAAATVLAGGPTPEAVDVLLPDEQTIRVPILAVCVDDGRGLAVASVIKDAGDDPDVTHGAEIRVSVSWNDGDGMILAAGEGVGMVTKPGLQVPPGQPAINPGPRRMITAAVRQVTGRGVRVEISIPGGRELAAKTFNPRLGVEGGLSILGTTGIVRPYCARALHDALKCAFDVAQACGVAAPVLVPGNIGARAARRFFALRDEQIVEVGNEWGFVLDQINGHTFEALLLAGHPGKLVKLAQHQWYTHSSQSSTVVTYLARLCREVLGRAAPDSPTAEGVFAGLADGDRKRLADAAAEQVRDAAGKRIGARLPLAVLLADMSGEALGSAGDLSPWQ